jgi:hypothetical protein
MSSSRRRDGTYLPLLKFDLVENRSEAEGHHGRSMNATTIPPDREPVRLGLLLSGIQIVVYFGFIFICCFGLPLLKADTLLGVPMSFILGFGVIACGVVVTAIYVVTANRSEGR